MPKTQEEAWGAQLRNLDVGGWLDEGVLDGPGVRRVQGGVGFIP